LSEAGAASNCSSAVTDSAIDQTGIHAPVGFVGAMADDRPGAINRIVSIGDPREYLETTAVALRNRCPGPFATRLPLPQAVKDPYP
jgi:hypothetical protein